MHQGGEHIGPRLERGLGYVALGPAEATVALLHELALARGSYLWVTERAMEPPANGGRVLRLTTLGTSGGLDPKRLGDLRTSVAGFVAGDASGLVVLDCLDYLVLHNGPERVLRVLADLHDEVSVHGGSLIVFVDARVANPRLVAWLERELDPLPREDLLHSESDGLPA